MAQAILNCINSSLNYQRSECGNRREFPSDRETELKFIVFMVEKGKGLNYTFKDPQNGSNKFAEKQQLAVLKVLETLTSDPSLPSLLVQIAQKNSENCPVLKLNSPHSFLQTKDTSLFEWVDYDDF
jgi:hypothetical protein